MIELISNFTHHAWSFIVVLSIIVFIHEFGHYIVAKMCGVKIDAFSIGFGPELFGYTDRTGTRWKISLLPLGGYVKMFGDASEASQADEEMIEHLPEEQKRLTFHHKSLPKKAAIVAAGPIANFLLTIAVFTYFIMTTGLPSVEPVVGSIMPDSPAQAAGLKPGDRVLKVNEKKMRHFNDIPMTISTNLGTKVTLLIERGDKEFTLSITPQMREDEDGLGNKMTRPLIGIKSAEITYKEVGLFTALGESVSRTYLICETTLQVMGQMITGKRSANELQGPVGIAHLSGQATQKDFLTVLWLIAMLSANLGLVNLLPIPMLDGGHLAFYTAEALRGRPLAEKVQLWGYRVGTALLLTLMAFTLFNDLRKLVF